MYADFILFGYMHRSGWQVLRGSMFSFWEKPPHCSPHWLYWFASLPTVCMGDLFYTSLPVLPKSCLFPKNHSEVRWYFVVVLIWIFLTVILNVFKCFCWSFIFLFLRNVYSSPLPISYLGCVVFVSFKVFVVLEGLKTSL